MSGLATIQVTLSKATLDAARQWEDTLRPLLGARPIGAAIAARAAELGLPEGQVRKQYYAYKARGFAGLVSRRHEPALWATNQPRGLSEADIALVKTYCERNQRKSAPALRALRADWRRGAVETATPLDPDTGYPRGWDERNLQRYAPSDFELQAARVGRGAAAAHRPLVYTTRAGLYVGQVYLFDDMWHDHMVNQLDQRKAGRPLEFHALDLASACKFAWGIRCRTEVDGTNKGLTGADFRFLLASVLATTGYHPQGTVLGVEHATAAIGEEAERILHDDTRGAISVQRGGIGGAAAHDGQYAGRSKGNFRFKAALESMGNLYHNEFAALPGQVGMDRDHCPEEMHDGGRLVDAETGKPLAKFGLLKHNDALLAALSQLEPERAQWLQWDICNLQQFRILAEEVYARINNRTWHDLEGWDAHYVPDPRTGRMRRKSPLEVWRPGSRALQPISDAALALILGVDSGVERQTRNGMIELRDGEISGDVLRYDGTALPDRGKYLTVLNPFDPRRLFCFDAKGRFIGALARIHAPCRMDSDAVHVAMGEAAKREALLLQPLRQRHLAEAREKLARHVHNAEVISGETAAETRAVARAVRAVDPAAALARMAAACGADDDES